MPRDGAYSFVWLNLRRPFNAPTGDLRIRVKEFAPGGPQGPEGGTVVGTATVTGSLVPTTNTWVKVRFSPAMTLHLSNASTPRYAFVADVASGQLAVAIACTEASGVYPGEAGLRRTRQVATNPPSRARGA